jgi:hypothetical protein
MTEQHPDPGGEAAARAAQLAAMTVSVAEAVVRLRAQRVYDRAVAGDQTAAADRARQAADAATARVVYGAALDATWRRTASTSELLDAWAAAGAYLDGDPTAALAAERVEERLRRLHPEALAAYDPGRSGGFPRQDCMDVAGLLWRGEYGLDPIGTPVARSLADIETARAAGSLGTPDLRSTPGVDDTHAATADAARHLGTAADRAAGTARVDATYLPAGTCRVVVGEAFPVDIHQSMATAPQAVMRTATAIRALTAAPHRRQLTAAPTATTNPTLRRTR